jgi:hypothetical protein
VPAPCLVGLDPSIAIQSLLLSAEASLLEAEMLRAQAEMLPLMPYPPPPQRCEGHPRRA